MMSPSRHFIGNNCILARFIGQASFTLVETLIGVSMVALLGAGSFWTMTTMNVYATSARLYSEATAKAEQQIDAILTKGPFDPSANPPQVPTELTNTVKNGVLIYKDPVSGQTIVTGTMTTEVADTGLTGTVGTTATNLNIWRATVKVEWTFRGNAYRWDGMPYSVSLDTLRTGNQ
jgi:type II secretory pathway pseudopilin PulG